MARWDDMRSRLNHDVLCNQVLNEVMALEADPCGNARRLVMWLGNVRSYEEFLDEAEYACSYSEVLKGSIFDCYSAELRIEVSNLFHEYFRIDTKIDEIVAECCSALQDAVRSVSNFVKLEEGARTVEGVRAVSKSLIKLSNRISDLPHTGEYS